jgi:predicted lipoprotein with Yx(FWY)xxD motif
MLSRIFSTAAFALAATLSFTARAQVPVKPSGGMLVDAAGMTVYTFDKDTAGSGKSACNGACATLWPAVMAAPDAKAEGDYSVVTRDDGMRQWALRGKPLYVYKSDAKPGDDFKNVWHVAKP